MSYSYVCSIENSNMNRNYKIFCGLFFGVFASLFLYSNSVLATSGSYFNMTESVFTNLKPFPKWTGVMARFAVQQEIPDEECGAVRYHPCEIKDWKRLIESLKEKSFDDQLEEINNWSNKHPYIVDQLNWGVNDYWETPYEFMEISGDCEDYAISKYYSLRAIGIEADRMRIMIVQDLNLGGIIHAILGVYDDDGTLMILDNQIKRVIPAMKIYHYRPIYGVNEENWWTYHPNM